MLDPMTFFAILFALLLQWGIKTLLDMKPRREEDVEEVEHN